MIIDSFFLHLTISLYHCQIMKISCSLVVLITRQEVAVSVYIRLVVLVLVAITRLYSCSFVVWLYDSTKSPDWISCISLIPLIVSIFVHFARQCHHFPVIAPSTPADAIPHPLSVCHSEAEALSEANRLSNIIPCSVEANRLRAFRENSFARSAP